jgi:uncharacterized protein (TIGR02265 family)
MSPALELLEELKVHCDIHERLELLPANARVRGVYFRSIEAVLGRAGRLSDYRALFPATKAAVLWYPAAEFMQQLVAGAALLTEPSRVHDGLFEIGRRNARVFAESLLGRLLIRFLSRDPRQLLNQALVGHRQGYSHSTWQLSFLDDRTACMSMSDEYMFIDSYLVGAARGTFEAIALPVEVEVQLDDRFRGRHLLRW